MTTLTAKVAASISAEFDSALDIGSVSYPVNFGANYLLTDGTGANQANQLFTDIRTLTASSTEDLDLSGVLLNAYGTACVFTKIKAIIVTAAAANTNDVLVGGAAATQVTSFFGDVTDVVKVKPGGMFMLVAPDATGYAITAGTADLLKVANSAGGTSVTYTIVLIGTI